MIITVIKKKAIVVKNPTLFLPRVFNTPLTGFPWNFITAVGIRKNRFFIKLFKTSNIDVVNYCRMQFNF